MRTVNHQLLVQLAVFIVLIFNTQFTYANASSEDESRINALVETYGKNSIVNFILQKRNGKITIQKKKSFLNATGRPDITLVTPKSINNDIKILKIDINNLESELETYVENETKIKQKEEESLSKSLSSDNGNGIPLSKQLLHKIKITQSHYNKAENKYDRKKLKKELSKLQRKYKEAKYNEKYNPGGNSTSSRKSTKSNSYNRSSSSCDNYKAQLQKLTEASYRHQIFYCSDRTYRAENPKTCGNYRYSKQYSLEQYKDELNRLRSNISKYCKS